MANHDKPIVDTSHHSESVVKDDDWGNIYENVAYLKHIFQVNLNCAHVF